jgi:ribosomal peptide maturation radical SAM protein 1
MQVLFVVMPFGSIRPAIGVSLLKAHLSRMSVPSRVLYLSMRFAQRVGLADYEYIAERSPSQSLAGDWIFASSLSGRDRASDDGYMKAFAERFAIFGPPRSRIAILNRVQPLAEPFIAECVDAVDWSSFDVIGFTSTFSQHAASLALAKRIKERWPAVRIAFGGANCEDVMGLQAHHSFPFVDFVCSGEADVSFPRLVAALRDGDDVGEIPGVISRRNGESRFVSLSPARVNDLDALPTPDYGDYFEQLAALRPQPRTSFGLLMETSRGCWWGEKHHCTFCGLNGMSMTFRSKSVDRVLEEIAELRSRYRHDRIEMVDNILDMKYFRDLIPALERQQAKLGLFYETKVNLTKAQLHAMRRAGIATIQPGIESLSSSVLRLMRKGTTAIQNIQLLKWCKEYGIRPYWNHLYGFPSENPADYESAATAMDSLHHLEPPHGVGPIRLDRFSPNFFDAERLGVVNVRPDRSYTHIYELSASELTNFAYYFEHDYIDGRNPEDYVDGLHAAVSRWHENSGNAGLTVVDHGEDLAIWDLRGDAEQTLTILDGYERALYLFCDQHRSLGEIQALPQSSQAGAAAVAASVDRLLDARLMIHLDDRYLSLAVSADPPVSDSEPPPHAAQSKFLPVLA